MAKTVTARIRRSRGAPLFADIANLSPSTVFLKTDAPIPLRERIELAFLGLTVVGEVVYVASTPPAGVVVAFEVRGADREMLRGVGAEVETLSETAPDTPPEGSASDQRQPSASSYESTTDTSGSSNPITNPITNPTTNPEQPASGEVLKKKLPALESDGSTVRFESLVQYRSQFLSNIAYGGIVVRSPPIPIGTSRMLELDLPGAGFRPRVSARVTFNLGGTVGFMIDDFAAHQELLAGIARST
jgi:hypothetical protein